MKLVLYITLFALVLGAAPSARAAKYVLQNRQDSVIGEVLTVQSELKDTLLDIARKHGLGYEEIKLVNPELDTWMPGKDKQVKLPLKFILPKTPRQGIVLNIPEMRLYYYPDNGKEGIQEVITYPLGVGREGWSTPYMKTKIIEKKRNPKWYPPESIRQEHEEAGDPLPKVVEAGPDNPLGDHAMRLGQPEYLIHGTNKPYGVGMRVSHGCIRLYPEHIADLFEQVNLGTPVEIVNQPYKIGELNGVLYLEAHPYLDEDASVFENNLTPIVKLIVESTAEQDYEIDWDLVREVARNPTGVPTPIGVTRIERVIAATDINMDEELNATRSKPSETVETESIINEAMTTQQQKLELRLDNTIRPEKYYR
ncbi:MAG: L,D-transpeptidase family protein [Gammaproteobacteria bacterium]|nr:L,D-transpeptidase family protein [Gammaproteobacteria bacterium]